MISMIFIFLSCREKAHDNKEFSREISKPRRESRKSNPVVHYLTNLLFFDNPLYFYINLRSSIISSLSSGDIYLFLGISLSC